MKTLKFCAFAAFAASCVFTACDNEPGPETVAVSGVTLDKPALHLVVGATETLAPIVTPDDATDRTVTWSSDRPAIASVEDGLVTALSPGEATVTVTTVDGGKTASCTVTVEAETVMVTAVELDKKTLTLTEGDEELLKATVSPDNATDATVTWSSSSETVARVDQQGLVTALSAGEATITATANDGSGHSDECAVTVEEPIDVLMQITDPAFLAYCTEKMAEWDTNGDGKLYPVEAAAVERIEMSRDRYYTGEKAVSFAGIEYFPNLYYLTCQWNSLAALDLSANTRLIELDCSNNSALASLDVSKCAELLILSCSNTPITELDVTGCTALIDLRCFNVYNSRTLTSLDAQGCGELETLYCYNNFALSSLNVSGCTSLGELRCYNCQDLVRLDLSGFAAMTRLDASYNPRLVQFDLTGCTGLTYLDISFSEALTSVDLSDCTALNELWCPYSRLASLDISKNSALYTFDCGGNFGDGVSKFVVKAWFDDSSVPYGFTAAGSSWEVWNEAEDTYPRITLEYRNVVN